MTMTPVTELRIGAVFTPWNWGRICKVSWLERATTLSNLRALYIRSPKEAVPLIGSLTSLTGLSWLYHDPRDHFPCWRDPYSIAPFTHLSRLRSLRLGYDTSEENLSIACSLGAGSLVDLRLGVGAQADTECGRYLTGQTALTRLRVDGQLLWNSPHIGALRVELLRSLSLTILDSVDAEGLDALRRATSLTDLYVYPKLVQQHLGWSQAISSLTQLRRLNMDCSGGDTKVLDFPLALCPLTALTRLEILSAGIDDGDLRALLVLTGLKELWFDGCLVTDEVVPELVVLTNLSTLALCVCEVTSLEAVTRVLNPLREARGWRPVYAVHE
jgi:hypothetical protein